MELEPITMNRLDDISILVYREFQTLLLWLTFLRVNHFWDLGQIVFPLVVSGLNFFSLKVTS